MLGQVATLGRHKGIAEIPGLRLRGFLGWFVARTYHLYQLPLVSRKLRVVLDWTVALFFRRDIVELSVLGHPRRPGERLAEPLQRLRERLLPASTPAKRSPSRATRSSTASIVNAAGSSPCATSSQRSGVETVAPARGRTE